MSSATKRAFTLLALPAIALVLGGCTGFAVSGYSETPVYGGYGYVEPWHSSPVVVEGGHFVAPPYERSDRYHRDEDSRRREEAPSQRAAPVEREARHPIPSIPNNPRPEGQRGGNNRNQR
jgi:hypothetical protein